MRTTLNSAEVLALARIGASRVSSGNGQLLPEAVARGLARERLARADEYGNMQITERGEQHLVALDHRGVVARAAAVHGPAPASRFRRRS